MRFFWKTFDWRGMRFGVSHDLLQIDGVPYLERWILWLGLNIRVHKFYRSDEDRALHDHPWAFITFPFQAYEEDYWDPHLRLVLRRTVKPWRFHYRPAKQRHMVIKVSDGPTWTFFMSWFKTNEWGFWPNGTFVHHKDWE